jgi:hypothetical protein
MKLLFVLLTLPLFSAAQVTLDLSAVPDTPALFANGIINTGLNERDMAISPDGKELFYTVLIQPSSFLAIISMKKDAAGKWSKPEVASFSGRYSDLEPAFSADGNKLFFVSNRPVSGDQHKDYDIWYMEKVNGQWGPPKNAGPAVNTAGNEYYPSVAQNGNLYFTAEYKKGVGREDIYVAKWENGQYTASVALDTAVNSTMWEFNAFVSPDEQFIVFSSNGRKDEKGRGDLYISRKDAQGQWLPAKNVAILNSDKIDYCPFVSFDKKILFFTSERHNLASSFAGKAVNYLQLHDMRNSILNGGGNIYWIRFDAVLNSLK